MKYFQSLSFCLISLSLSAQVGIGTTSPSEELDIESNDGTNTSIDINNTGAGDPLVHFQISSTSAFTMGVDNDDSDKLKIGTTALETNTRLTIDGSGNVGIGVTAPAALLDVDGSAVFNDSHSAVDFRIEGDTDSEIFFVDGSADAIGISTTTPASGLDIQTSMGLGVTTITSATTLDNTHNVVLCNTGAYTVTLPAAASHTGKVYYIKNIDTDSDDITIDGNGGETIDGAATVVLYVQYDAIRIVSDGTEWHIIDDERIPHKCVLTRDAVQAITNATATEVLFDAEGVDNAGMGLSDGTDGNSITIQRAGEYIVTADWTFQFGDANNYVRTYIYVNGSAARVAQSRNVSANALCTAAITYTATFAAGDDIDMWIQHNEGTTENTEAAADERPRLTVTEVR